MSRNRCSLLVYGLPLAFAEFDLRISSGINHDECVEREPILGFGVEPPVVSRGKARGGNKAEASLKQTTLT